MIFRTINADAKKLTEQFGLLNKSFRDINKDFTNGLGFKNSLFQTSISKTDYQALQKFDSAIKLSNDGLTKSQRITKAWNENMTRCSIAAKRMGNDLVTGKKNIQDISKAMNTTSGSTKALGAAMNVMANVGFMLAITAIAKVVSELAQAQEKAVQVAKEATETYKSQLDSIADYKQRLSELHKELKSGDLSYEETKTKRTELMSIQDELIEKFGSEKGAIKSVTDAVNGQVDALDNLNEKAYRDWVAKADSMTFWDKVLPGGKSGLDQAIDYMETKKTVSFYDMQNANLSDELQALQKEIDETIRAKYNLDKTFSMFNVTGTPDELRTQLENIRQDYADISKKIFDEKNIPDHGMWKEYQKEAIDSINEAIISLDKGLEKHQDTYRTYIEGLIKYDSEYSDEYANILQKRAELESAQNSGNAEEVKRAKQEFMDSINDAIIASDSDESIKKYFESLYPELQAEFSKWTFEFDLEANVKGLADTAKEIGKKYTATDLLNMVDTEGIQEGEESFNSLIDKAIAYGVCTDKSAEEVQKLIDLLVELGIVQDNVKGDNFNDQYPISFFHQLTNSTESLDKFQSTIKSAADAYTKLLSGNYSSTDLLDSIQSINQAASDMKGTIAWEEIESLDELGDKIEEISQTHAKSVLSGAGIDIDSKLGQMLANIIQEAYESEAALASLNTQIDSLQDSYKNLTDIIETYNEHGYVTFDQLQTLLSMEPQYLSCLIDKNGQLQLNQEAMRELAEQRLKDARAQIIEQTITKLGELQFKKEKTAIDDARMAIEDIDGTLTSYGERLLEFIPIGELTTEEFIKISNAVNGAALNGVSDEDIDAALQNAEKMFKFLKDMWNGEIGSMFGGFASSEKASDTIKEFDWIEQAIENVRKEIQSLDEIATSSYATFSQKNTALAKEIEKVSEEIALQQKAYEEYMRKADSTGLADHYKALAQNGSASIEDISDEKLLEQIDTYRQWYDKAQSAADAVKKLNTDLKDLHVSAYELHTEDLKDRLDNGSLTEKQYLRELKAAYERFYGNLEEYAQQYHEAVLDCLKLEKEYLNTVAGAAVSLLDTEIDAVRDRADEQEEQLKKQIELLEEKKKPLQEELDALEEKARKEDLILNLQKAQYDLARAENQRTKLVYKDGQLVYTNDSKAARDAQKGLDDAKLEIQKQSIQDRLDGLDEEISRYNDLIDQINKAADTQIKALEKIKDKWQEITHQQEHAKNITILTGEFGADAIERLLSGELLEQWKNSYISILSAIDMETQGYIGEMTKQLAELYKGASDETGARIAVPSASPSREESGNQPSGTAMISGAATASGDSVLTPLQPGDEMYGMMQKWNAYMDSINGNVEKLIPYSVNDHNRQMSEAARRISNVSNVVNNNRNVQPVVNHINVTCPGVTEQQVAERLGKVIGKELDKQFNGFHNYVDQMSRIR